MNVSYRLALGVEFSFAMEANGIDTEIVGQAQALFAEGKVREPNKVVLRPADTAASEEHGRFNGLAASIGSPPQQMGMKWIASFPANRKLGLPRATALIILNSPRTGVPLAV